MKRSEKEINNILNSLEGVQRAQARPFMYTRIMARMEDERSIWAHIGAFIAKPVVAIACLVAVIGTNFYFVEKANHDSVAATSVTDTQEDSYLTTNTNNYILASLGE